MKEVGYDGALTVEFVAPIDRTPANRYPDALETNPVDISPEELQFIIDHGSSLLSEGFYSMLVEQCATTLLPLHLTGSPDVVKIADVEATVAGAARSPPERQHVSDFGRIASFDMALVRIEADDGSVGWGEAKAAVGQRRVVRRRSSPASTTSSGPALIGLDARDGSTRPPTASTTGREPAMQRRGAGCSRSSGGAA